MRQTRSIRYTRCATTVGDVWVAWTEDGICAISSSAASEGAFLEEVRPRFPAVRAVARADEASDELARLIDRYMATGECARPLDFTGLTRFERSVYEAVGRIARGRMGTYGDVARAAGHPGAARAVGNAMARNPIPILVPCHRVVPAGGGLGSYSGGGKSRKEFLLRVEGALGRADAADRDATEPARR